MRYIMVTGSRHATFHHYYAAILDNLDNESSGHVWELIHGGARGVDRIAKIAAGGMKHKPLLVKEFQANWDAYGQAAGPIRNEAMTDYIRESMSYDDTAICLAFHHDWRHGSGTNNAIEYAESAGITVVRITVNQPIVLPKKRPLVKL